MTRHALPDADRAAAALHYLAETDGEYGQIRARVKMLEWMLKHHKAKALLMSSAKTIAAKEAEYLASDEYVEQIRELEDAHVEEATLHARRQRAVLELDLYRTLESSRRAGVT